MQLTSLAIGKETSKLVNLSIKSLVGSSCGFGAKDRNRQTQIIPLLSCTKNISKHLMTLSFSGPQYEKDLILSRAALFDVAEESIKSRVTRERRPQKTKTEDLENEDPTLNHWETAR